MAARFGVEADAVSRLRLKEVGCSCISDLVRDLHRNVS